MSSNRNGDHRNTRSAHGVTVRQSRRFAPRTARLPSPRSLRSRGRRERELVNELDAVEVDH
ncbi:hypothetical protein [Halorientalis marina]|uniref:hypothetical protein n=1 Tax=Halorientalis marina TaxID=2931976 RepID=UPI001FF40078|nr:hypothetical protein [Halorientalis marina]